MKSKLDLRKCIISFQVCHNVGVDYVLKYFATNTCEGNWVIIARVTSDAFLEEWRVTSAVFQSSGRALWWKEAFNERVKQGASS